MADRRPRAPTVPTKPGVYILKDGNGRVIYVGKALNLRNRLRTYTSTGEAPDPKVAALRARVRGFDTIVTRSETEALILEANLIKEHHPRYNVKLRDDKKYPLVKVTLGETYPRASVTRTVREDGSRYFGPYTDAKAIRRTLRTIRQLFPVRQCPTFKRRTRPCLNFQIGRCLGPCRGVVAPEEYGEMIAELCLFLDGRAGDVVARLREHMVRASDARQFEEAARTRDRIADIEKIAERQRVVAALGADRDVVAVARHGSTAVASVVRVREGKLLACEAFRLDLSPETEDDEVAETFLKQFYSLAPDPPRTILVDRDLADAPAIGRWLSERSGGPVSLLAPKRGEKRSLVDFAAENAEQAFRRAFETRRAPRLVAELGAALGMSRPPRLISAVDVSNVGGAQAVGTVVSFRDGRPDRSAYRKYRIKTVKGSDDCAMIREVVSRHLRRAIKEESELPDLLLVDGGKGQLGAAEAAVRDAGARGVFLVALAKREEEIFVSGRVSPLPFSGDVRAKRLLERARNEVHRTSVTYHRSLREKDARRSLLDDIRGIGSARKEALLRRFGSVHAIAERSVEELAEVPGIGIETARKIEAALRGTGRRDHAAA